MIFARYRLERLSELLTEPWNDLRIPGLLDLINVVKPKRMLEIGSFKGVSTEVFLLHAKHVTALDPWENNGIYTEFYSRVGAYPHLNIIRGKSPDAVPPAPEKFDFVYIDGDHSFEAVCEDIVAAWSVLDRYGQIGGHDYDGVDTPGVKRAVDYAFPERKPIVFADSSWLMKTT